MINHSDIRHKNVMAKQLHVRRARPAVSVVWFEQPGLRKVEVRGEPRTSFLVLASVHYVHHETHV